MFEKYLNLTYSTVGGTKRLHFDILTETFTGPFDLNIGKDFLLYYIGVQVDSENVYVGKLFICPLSPAGLLRPIYCPRRMYLDIGCFRNKSRFAQNLWHFAMYARTDGFLVCFSLCFVNSFLACMLVLSTQRRILKIRYY